MTPEEFYHLLEMLERLHRRTRIYIILNIICIAILVSLQIYSWYHRDAADRPAPPVVPLTQVHPDHSAT